MSKHVDTSGRVEVIPTAGSTDHDIADEKGFSKEIETASGTGTTRDSLYAEERKQAERKLVFKIDSVIMPLTMLLYLMAYLDRGNFGNAKIMGMEAEIFGNDDRLFDWANSVLYFGLILFQVPGNIGAKLVPSNIWIGAMAIGWGTMSTLQAAMHNSSASIALRFFLGMFEAGFGPAIPLYFSIWYTRSEIGLRTALFIGTAAAAGAFGGGIAYGVSLIQQSPIANWRILFLIEGIPSIVLGFIILVWLPKRPDDTNFLNEDERAIALERMNRDVTPEAPNTFNKHEAWAAIKDYKTYFLVVCYIGINVALSSITAFLPTIITSLGYTASLAQLMTVPPYSVAFVVMCSVSWICDRYKTRGFPVAGMAVIGAIGYLVLVGVHFDMHVRYFCTFLICFSTYTAIPFMMSWCANNAASESKRAISLGVMIGLGHTGSVIGSHIFPSSDGPYYRTGFAICASLVLLAGVSATILSLIYRRSNNIKQAQFGTPAVGDRVAFEEGEKSPVFRYIP